MPLCTIDRFPEEPRIVRGERKLRGIDGGSSVIRGLGCEYGPQAAGIEGCNSITNREGIGVDGHDPAKVKEASVGKEICQRR